MHPVIRQRILLPLTLGEYAFLPNFFKTSSFSTDIASQEKPKKGSKKKSGGSEWEKATIYKLSREYEAQRKEHLSMIRQRELQAISLNYILNNDVRHLFGTATNYVNMLMTNPNLEVCEEYLAVVLKYASVILKDDYNKRSYQEWHVALHNIMNFLSRVYVHNDLSAMGYISAFTALRDFLKKHGSELKLPDANEVVEKCQIKAEYISKKFDLTTKQLLFNANDVAEFVPSNLLTFRKQIVQPDYYQKDISMVAELINTKASNADDSPFTINQRSKSDYLKNFSHQLQAERGGYMEVKNFVRDESLEPIESMINKWGWQEQIKHNLKERASKVQDSLLKKSLNELDYDKCATRLVTVVLSELSQGADHIGINSFERQLAEVILNEAYNRFINKLQVNPETVTREIFQLFVDYFCDPKIAQQYTMRQWWKLCCAEQNADPTLSLPYEHFKGFVAHSMGSFLSDIVLSSCTFPLDKYNNRALDYGNVKFESESSLISDGKKIRVEKMIRVNPQLISLIKKHGFKHLLFPQKLLPLLLPPRPWIDKGMNGPLYTSSSNILRKLDDFPDIDVNKEFNKRLTSDATARPAIDALNVLGSTPWIVNGEMLDVLHKVFILGSDKTQEEMLSKLSIPLHSSTQIVRDFIDVFGPDANAADITSEQWRDFYNEKIQAVKTKNNMNSVWCWLRYRITLALHYRNDVLFFPHNMDFRGRVYPISPYLNHMGDDINRCILKFAKGKRLGERGLYWLKLHIINITGLLKKKSVDDRMKYFYEHLDDILDSANNPLDGRKWWLESDDPWQTLAACKELRDALKLENPEEFISHLPIHQDGSCNGLQHYAALGRDRQGALEVNLCPADAPADIYSSVAIRVEQRRIEDENDETSEHHEIAKDLRAALPEPVPRKVVKQTVMTTVYGVTEYGARQQIKRQLKALGKNDEDAMRFASYLTEQTFSSLTEAFSTSMQIKEWLREAAAVSSHLMKPVEWTTPLGMPVMQPYIKIDSKLNKICRLPYRSKQINAFPPNYVHSLDSTHMMLTALFCHRAAITFAAVHDCYWTHASSVDVMNKICREQFVSMYKQPLIQKLAEEMQRYCLPKEVLKKMSEEEANEVMQKLTPTFKFGELDIEEVKKSVYFFS